VRDQQIFFDLKKNMRQGGKMIKVKFVMFLMIGLIMLGFFRVAAIASDDIPRMTKEELKGMLGNPDLVILDVRVRSDWEASEFKIKGAVRELANNFISWANKYPKDKTIVLYCA